MKILEIFSINIYGIFIGLGIIAGLFILQKEGTRKKLDIDILYNLAIGGIVTGIIGARLYYVFIFNPNFFMQNPVHIFMIHQGGLSIQGALIGAIIFSSIYIKYKKLSFWKIADSFAPGLIIGKVIGRIGCDVFGYTSNQRNDYDKEGPKEIARRRYARGEIDKKELEEILNTLEDK